VKRFLKLIVLFVSLLPAQAFSRSMSEQITQLFEAGELSGLHSVLILRDGQTLAEAYFAGKDENWGRDIGNRQFDSDSLHDLRSVTKNITGLLYGIALEEGVVPPVTASVIAQFPQYAALLDDDARRSITIGHTLSMTLGTEWNKNLPYTDPKNSEIQIENAADRIEFVLSRPLVAKPGEVWNYNGGASAVVARLIENGSGQSLDEYAKEKLFNPLGITEFEWSKGADGAPSAASGLRLKIHDLARIGQLILDDGLHDDKQIVPAEWLASSFAVHADKLTSLAGPLTTDTSGGLRRVIREPSLPDSVTVVSACR
jgi:CubicO group peptidase (beta-lactamase class C family)